MTVSKSPNPFLEGNTFFAILSPEEKVSVGKNAKVLSFSKNQAIYEPGATTSNVYVLIKGSVKVTIHAEKKDIIKYVIRPGMLFGESFITGELMRRDFAYSMEDNTEVLEIDAHVLLSISRSNFGFAQMLLSFIGDKLRYTEQQLEKVVLKDSKSRILEYLHQMGVEQGKLVGMETLVRHNMTHQDIADLTGTSRQMVTAVLNQLKRQNLLYFNRKKILFRNLSALPGES